MRHIDYREYFECDENVKLVLQSMKLLTNELTLFSDGAFSGSFLLKGIQKETLGDMYSQFNFTVVGFFVGHFEQSKAIIDLVKIRDTELVEIHDTSSLCH